MTYKTSNGEELDVIIIRKKNKNIYFRVKDDLKLYITCPIYLSTKSIEKLLEENRTSIDKLYLKALGRKEDDDIFLYLGNKYKIVIDEACSKVTIEEDRVITKDLEMLDDFYEREVIRVFTAEVEIAKKCFSHLPEFSLKFRHMISRWGVCNRSKMTVTLNTELLKKDISLIDYVIIHELCHFYEGNHSKAFWQLVGQAYPNYKEARKALRG